MKDKFINFRATEKEIKQIDILARKARMTRSDFIRHAIFNKEIVVIDGVRGVQKELKRIGNNLNQLTTRANMGQMQVVDLDETKMEVIRQHRTTLYHNLYGLFLRQNHQKYSTIFPISPAFFDNYDEKIYSQILQLELCGIALKFEEEYI